MLLRTPRQHGIPGRSQAMLRRRCRRHELPLGSVFRPLPYRDLRRPRDLLSYDGGELLKLQNFGRKSLRDLYDALLGALSEGPFDAEIMTTAASLDSLLEDFDRSLSGLDDRERDVLLARMGLRRPVETLQEIGDRYHVTRERIRQIEARAVEKISKTAFWCDLLATKLEALLMGREFPLPVLGVEAVDAWFAGVGKSSSALRFILANLCGGRFSVVQIKDIEYVGRINEDEWIQTEREARRLLATGPEQGWSEVHCQTLINSLLDESRREFRPLLWQSASALCHFVDASDGARVLASYGHGADQVVEAVLRDSDTPLHYSEIADRARERSGREIDVRRAHNAERRSAHCWAAASMAWSIISSYQRRCRTIFAIALRRSS